MQIYRILFKHVIKKQKISPSITDSDICEYNHTPTMKGVIEYIMKENANI